MATTIRIADVSEIYPIRNEVLRPGLSIESCYYPEDSRDGVFHLIAEQNEVAVGIASFYPEKHPEFTQANSWRLRGMATVDEVRGAGFGIQLLQKGIEECRHKGADLLWCNARTSALGFYQKLNFGIKGDEFMIENIGPHFLMYYQYKR